MKTLKIFIVLIAFTTISYAQTSPRLQATGTVDGVKIDIDYSAPSVKGRVIWGGLEKYGEIWRAGANSNTTFSFSKNVRIDGKDLPAGKYSFFIIPNKEGAWTIILNSKTDIWKLRGYDKANDMLRADINPKMVNENQEQLKYSVTNYGIEFAWEKVRLSIPVKAN
ncbi:DUF2911 domain-containing protein [Flavobacteriaceae bacterium F08102]|nr:DUF2911 domain-containing protein [Flavobacteriaceae bacterium F08102]